MPPQPLGMDPEWVMAVRLDLHEILIQGLPPLEKNETLYEAARKHTADMLENDYYSHE